MRRVPSPGLGTGPARTMLDIAVSGLAHVTESSLDGSDRIVTFFTGAIVRERLVDLDEEARRLVWSVMDGPYTHDNASAQVFDEPTLASLFLSLGGLAILYELSTPGIGVGGVVGALLLAFILLQRFLVRGARR